MWKELKAFLKPKLRYAILGIASIGWWMGYPHVFI